jgi:hypothetical protein
MWSVGDTGRVCSGSCTTAPRRSSIEFDIGSSPSRAIPIAIGALPVGPAVHTDDAGA